jgi:putative membrane protein (TIGR04086 family)
MRNETVYGNGLFSVIKATATALALSLLLAVLFAVVLRSATVPSGVIYPVNQILKNIALATGVLSFVRGEKGWLKGGGTGLLFTALSYLAFSAIGGNFSLSWLIAVEILTAFLVGAIGGSLAVNMKK